MIAMDYTHLPLIDAGRLFELRGCEAICDVPLPDATLPVNGVWRMTQEQWDAYRARCGAAEAGSVRVLADCWACPLLWLWADFAPVPDFVVWPVLFVVSACALGWVALADVGDFYQDFDVTSEDEERR